MVMVGTHGCRPRLTITTDGRFDSDILHHLGISYLVKSGKVPTRSRVCISSGFLGIGVYRVNFDQWVGIDFSTSVTFRQWHNEGECPI